MTTSIVDPEGQGTGAGSLAALPQVGAPPSSHFLSDLLPSPMARDPFYAGLARIFDDASSTTLRAVDSLPAQLDIGLADPPLLRFLAAWIDVRLSEPTRDQADVSRDLERQRECVRQVIQVLGWRGTRRGLEGVLGALTGGPVTVRDPGRVVVAGESVPPGGGPLEIELTTRGGLSEGQLRSLVEEEVPVGTVIVLSTPGDDHD